MIIIPDVKGKSIRETKNKFDDWGLRYDQVKETYSFNTEKGKVTNITLAVPRSFKNANGEYDTDFISCVLWKGVAESTVEYCKKGDLVGIKGRIQTRDVDLDDETHKKYVEVIAEKVTFLSSNRNKEAE